MYNPETSTITQTTNDINIVFSNKTISKLNISTFEHKNTINDSIEIPSFDDKNIWKWTLNDYHHNILRNLSLRALIYQASKPDGSDNLVPFPIGSVHRFTTALLNCSQASFPYSIETLEKKINKHPTNSTFNHLVFNEMTNCFNKHVLQYIPESRKNTVMCGFRGGTDHHRRGNASQTRNTIIRTLKKNGILNHMMNITQFDFYRRVLNSKFIIAPEGNGIDCHRTYDTIVFGAIPVVESEHERVMRGKYGNVPILFTKNYSEITPEYLEEIYPTMVNEMYDYRRIFIKSYDMMENKSLVEDIRKFGNHWVKAFTHVKYWMGDIMIPYYSINKTNLIRNKKKRLKTIRNQ